MSLRTALAVATVALGSVLFAAEMPWAESYEAAQAKAKEENKVVMVDFYTDWCTWCKRLDEETFSNEQVIEAARNLVVVKVNAEEEGVELAEKFNVTGYPTVIFASPDGEKIGTVVGYMPPEDFLPNIQTAALVTTRVPEIQAALEEQPTVELHLEMIKFKEFAGDSLGVVSHLEKAIELGYEGDDISEKYFLAGDAQVNAGGWEASLPYFEKALGTAKTDVDKAYALAGLTYSNANLQNMETAAEYAKQILAIESDDPNVEGLKSFAEQYAGNE